MKYVMFLKTIALLLPLITTEMSEEDLVLLVMVGGVFFIILIQVYDVLIDSLVANISTAPHLLISSDFGMIPNRALSTLQIDLVLIVRESSINRNRRMDTIFMLSM